MRNNIFPLQWRKNSYSSFYKHKSFGSHIRSINSDSMRSVDCELQNRSSLTLVSSAYLNQGCLLRGEWSLQARIFPVQYLFVCLFLQDNTLQRKYFLLGQGWIQFLLEKLNAKIISQYDFSERNSYLMLILLNNWSRFYVLCTN